MQGTQFNVVKSGPNTGFMICTCGQQFDPEAQRGPMSCPTCGSPENPLPTPLAASQGPYDRRS